MVSISLSISCLQLSTKQRWRNHAPITEHMSHIQASPPSSRAACTVSDRAASCFQQRWPLTQATHTASMARYCSLKGTDLVQSSQCPSDLPDDSLRPQAQLGYPPLQVCCWQIRQHVANGSGNFLLPLPKHSRHLPAVSSHRELGARWKASRQPRARCCCCWLNSCSCHHLPVLLLLVNVWQ